MVMHNMLRAFMAAGKKENVAYFCHLPEAAAEGSPGGQLFIVIDMAVCGCRPKDEEEAQY